MVGTVTGEVTVEQVAAIGPGRRVLVQAAAVVAVVALLVAVVVAGSAPVVLLVTGAAPLLLQALVLALRPRGDTDPSPGGREQTTERLRFRVVEASGHGTECVLLGRPSGGALRRGDVVEVYGRTDGDATVRAREVVVVADQRPLRGVPDTGFLLTRVADVATVALAVIGVVAAVVTTVVG